MAGKVEQKLEALKQFLPDNTFDSVMVYFKQYTIVLTLTRERKTVLGDYRCPTKEKPWHRISVNANLNSYSFLITLLHELAHLVTFQAHGRKVLPHGKEWKLDFRNILLPFTGGHIFPEDIERALNGYLSNPAASSCTDKNLYLALRNYDEKRTGIKMVSELPVGSMFITEGGRKFQVLEHKRTRAKCSDIGNEKLYLFQGLYEIFPVE